MLIGFIIWSIVAIILLFIGLSCKKSDAAVGFFTFSDPPMVSNVKEYNNKVSLLWIISAIVFEIIGIPMLFLKQNSPVFVFIMFAIIIWVIVLIVIYLKIEEKYKNK